jgi:hypothetical protein
MKVLNICHEDHANFSYDNCQALRSVGVDAESVKVRSHPFSYALQSRLRTIDEIERMINDYDVIQIMHSSIFPFEIKKPKVVWHTGTIYRLGYNSLNEVFKGVKPIIALGEFAELCPNAEYVVGAINVDKYVPTYTNGNKFAHYPSDTLVKGTSYIVRMFKEMEIELNYSTEKVSYAEQLKRMSDCDIYVELFALTQHNRPYGSWGITALEAAALGKVVMTCHTTKQVYEQTYGDNPLIVSNDEQNFKDNLKVLSRYRGIKELKYVTRNWVERNHSYQATGKRVKEILEKL